MSPNAHFFLLANLNRCIGLFKCNMELPHLDLGIASERYIHFST